MRDHILYQLEIAKENLVGGTIIGTAIDEEEDYFGLEILHENGSKVIAWIERDPEGNGPGAITLQEVIP